MSCRMACAIECTVACAHSCQGQCQDMTATSAIAKYTKEQKALEEILNSGPVGLEICKPDKRGYLVIPDFKDEKEKVKEDKDLCISYE